MKSTNLALIGADFPQMRKAARDKRLTTLYGRMLGNRGGIPA